MAMPAAQEVGRDELAYIASQFGACFLVNAEMLAGEYAAENCLGSDVGDGLERAQHAGQGLRSYALIEVVGVEELSQNPGCGVADGGKIDIESMQNALTFAKEVGTNFGKELDAKSSEDDLWTNRFVDGAKSR